MMKVLFDSQIFSIQKFGGISRYYTEIISSLKSETTIKVRFPLVYTENHHLIHAGLGRNYFLENAQFRGSTRLRDYLLRLNRRNTLNLLRQKKVDVFVPTYYDPYFLPFLNGTPFVLTVYDMIHELFPHYFSPNDPTVFNKRLLVNKADKVIAISESTKADILKIYPEIPDSKIDVVYLNHSIDFDGEVKKPAQLSHGSYLLFVGMRWGYKNFNWFVEAVAEFLKKRSLKLICLGGHEFNDEEKALLRKLGIETHVLHFTLKDDELKDFYSSASAFVFPSKYEGFGIPVLESMACECPVVLPKVSSFPEVAGDAGVYFELDQPETLIKTLTKLLDDRNYRDDIILKGKSQVKSFSWGKTTTECLAIYNDVAIST